jgi:hypothetical protein
MSRVPVTETASDITMEIKCHIMNFTAEKCRGHCGLYFWETL